MGNKKNILIYLLIVSLVGLCGYLYYQKSKAEQNQTDLKKELNTTDVALQAVQDDYNAALSKLDALKTENLGMDSLIDSKDGEIATLKKKIESILSNETQSQKSLEEAKKYIELLNNKLNSYEKQIAQLKESNANLATEKEKVTQERNSLQEEKASLIAEKKSITKERDLLNEESKALVTEKKVLESKIEEAKILSASNIELKPFKKRFLTGAEANTDKARRTELIRIGFDLNENKLQESGNKDIYVVVYGPDGNAYGDNKFQLINGTEKNYTLYKQVNFNKGQGVKNILLDWKPESNKFTPGSYLVEIYEGGHKIGSQEVNLK